MKKKKITLVVLAFLLGVVVGTPIMKYVHANYGKTIQVVPGANIEVDGKIFTPKDVNGKEVETFIYNGTTYVPIRAISNIYGAEIDWEQKNLKVKIKTKKQDEFKDMVDKTGVDKTKYSVDILRIEQIKNTSSYETKSNNTVDKIDFPRKLENMNKIPMEELKALASLKNHYLVKDNLFKDDALSKYTEDTFKDNKIFVGTITKNSGSIKLSDAGLAVNEGELVLKIKQDVPEIGTTDMAYYVVILSVDKSVATNKEVFMTLE